ncbi:DNA internalization-related competence protein ComEC/Rec2 [Photobacterium proteolyticum]|uniref:DNA internalization-related competence protein ComEC/Rec2 n=1 Tax=Photobacterium proteolyticum TaxID=1903952 RepID=A0A1Q9GG25_9GAMM|nr:DNA internalization-related competence protein ComEC/Rec2 [Photobacterium proteolyticum]OLQ73390.1 DNA internalization-related competence protein ComEC/Rec2 [Photobacterium proteolyticum]
MNQAVAGIALGILSLHFWPLIPDYIWFITALMIGGVVLYLSRLRLLIWVVIGAFVAKIGATFYADAVRLIPNERENITIVGEVSSLINQNIPASRFDFTLSSIGQHELPVYNPLRVRLEWPRTVEMKQGERWELEVRLRRPYGRVNHAGFDAERYFLGNQLHGKGTVLSGRKLPSPIRSGPVLSEITSRQRLLDRVVALTENLTNRSYLLALGFGFRDGLSDKDWLLLRDSGLSHLMAISGLHIGLAVVCGWWLGSQIRGIGPEWDCLLWLPLWLGLLFALGYAWLAGFSLPTQRALLMSTMVMVLIRCRVHWPGWQILLLALMVCLILNPLGSYSAGLWLSFSAVFVLYIASVSGVRADTGGEATWLRNWSNKLKLLVMVQLVLMGMMLPVQWLWFGGVSVAAVVVNLFAVPWVSFLTVPLVLAAIASLWLPSLSAWLWWLADLSLFPVLRLAELASGSWWRISVYWLPYLFGVLVLAILLWFLPVRTFKALYAGAALVIVNWHGALGLLDHDVESKPGWQVEMLDVGHGLAVLIRRGEFTVLYDTGNRWEQGSVVTAVIEPVMLATGRNRLDGLILSHADSDHAGGLVDVITRLKPGWKRSSDRRAGFMPCLRGEQWQWLQLDFRVLWPPRLVERAANPHSCVIEISDRTLSPDNPTSVLLTGDIDAISELLLANLEPGLNPEVLLVPHHGSNSSSTATWLAKMTPAYALVSVARYSPWPLPSAAVRQRYVDKGAVWLSTARSGQVSVSIYNGDIDILRYRQEVKNSWYRALFNE